MLGDANLCSHQRDEESYYQFNVATELKSGSLQCGQENLELRKTYMADRLRKDGTIIESALDNIYVSIDQKQK